MSAIIINNLSVAGASAANDIGAASGSDTADKIQDLIGLTDGELTQIENIVASGLDSIADGSVFQKTTVEEATQIENIVSSGLDAIADGSVFARTSVAGAADAESIATASGLTVAERISALFDAEEAPRLPTADEKTRLSDIQAASGATTALKLANLTTISTASQQGVIQLPSASGFAPMSVAGSADTDIGRFRRYLAASNAAAVLPAGGKWKYRLSRRGPNMQIIGTPLVITGTGTPALAALDSQYFVLIDSTRELLETYRFDGSAFTKIGNSLSIPGIGAPSIKPLSATRIALYDAILLKLGAYDWNGTDWTQVGNLLTISGAGAGAIAALTSTDIAFIDSTLDELRTYSFDGTNWTQVGSGLVVSGVAGNPALAQMSATRVAFIDSNNDSLRVYDWDGSTWSVGAGALSISGVSNPALSKLSSTNVVMVDSGNDKLREYSYATGAWVQVGAGVPIAGIGAPAVCYLIPSFMPYGYLIFIDATLDTLMAFDYDGSMGRVFEEVSSVAAGGTTVGVAVDGYYWSGEIEKLE